MSLVIIFSSFLISIPKASAVSVIDQEYYKSGDGSLAVKSHVMTTQTFRPGQPSLDKVAVNLRNTSGTANIVISKFNGVDWDPLTYINGQAIVDGWNTFDFADLEVTVGGRYSIRLDASTYDTQWYYGTGNPYVNGYAIWDQWVDQPDSDFHFRTYGYGPEVPAEQPAANTPPSTTTSTAANSTSTTGLSATPKTTVSKNIAAPGNPLVTYDDINKAAFFSWKASTTTGVEGYIISRSEDGTTYADLGAVAKDITSYSDKNVTAEKTYHYQVKAYKGTLSSPASTAVSLTIPAAPTENSANENNAKTGFFTRDNIILFGGGLLALILAIILGILVYKRRKRNVSSRVV